jgi:hypothetical protein
MWQATLGHILAALLGFLSTQVVAYRDTFEIHKSISFAMTNDYSSDLIPLSEPLGEKLILCRIRPRSRYAHGLVIRATNYVRARRSP